jgi:hypothetical protein
MEVSRRTFIKTTLIGGAGVTQLNLAPVCARKDRTKGRLEESLVNHRYNSHRKNPRSSAGIAQTGLVSRKEK